MKLKLAFEVINPQLVVDHVIKKQELEDLTLTKCGNNVHTYFTTIQEKQNEINANLPDSEEYPDHHFHTNMFTQLEKLTCDDFLINVKDSKRRWIKSPDTFDQATDIGDLIKLYTKYASTGTWMNSNEKDAKIISITTEPTRRSSITRARTTGPTAPERSPGSIPGIVEQETPLGSLALRLQQHSSGW